MYSKAFSPAAYAAFVFLAILVFAGLCAPWLSPYDYAAQDLSAGLAVPSWQHWLGQDKLGRDVFTRLLWGARLSLATGVGAVCISLAIGTTLGLISGYLGGFVDVLMMQLVDIFLAFPGILLAIALAAVLGPSPWNVVVALSAFGWVPFCRMVRGQVLSLRERDYVVAARAFGSRPGRIMCRHLLPGVAGTLVVQTSFSLAGAILAEASLSFLGLGPQNLPSWGAMLSEGAEFLGEAPHLSWSPGSALVMTVLSFHVVGDALRDTFLTGPSAWPQRSS